MLKRTLLGAAALLAVAMSGADAQMPTEEQGITGNINFELNKLEPQENACRTYFVIANDSDVEFNEIRLDMFIFDREEIIARRVALSTRRILPNRTRVVLFDLAEMQCADVGRFLLNDILACEDTAGATRECGDVVTVSTRTDAEFVY